MRAAFHERFHNGSTGVKDREIMARTEKAMGHPPAHSPHANEPDAFFGHG
jgi:hypothetical protein